MFLCLPIYKEGAKMALPTPDDGGQQPVATLRLVCGSGLGAVDVLSIEYVDGTEARHLPASAVRVWINPIMDKASYG